MVHVVLDGSQAKLHAQWRNSPFKDVHRQQKLTTDFFKLFELTTLVVTTLVVTTLVVTI